MEKTDLEKFEEKLEEMQDESEGYSQYITAELDMHPMLRLPIKHKKIATRTDDEIMAKYHDLIAKKLLSVVKETIKDISLEKFERLFVDFSKYAEKENGERIYY